MLVFILVYYVSSTLRHYYLQHYVAKLDGELRGMFISWDKKIIISYHLLLIVVMTFCGYIVAEYIGSIVSLCLAFVIPFVMVKRARQKRIVEFIQQLPDVMNSLSAMLKAGTHLSKAMHLIAEQQVTPVSQELMIVLSEYKMGQNMNVALGDMSRRINRQEVELLVSAIAISSHVGGNLASTLDILSETLREKITIEGKIDALTAMGRMQGNVVSFIPAAVLLVLYVQDPEGILALFYEPVGWVAILILLALMGTAFIMIRKITNITI